MSSCRRLLCVSVVLAVVVPGLVAAASPSTATPTAPTAPSGSAAPGAPAAAPEPLTVTAVAASPTSALVRWSGAGTADLHGWRVCRQLAGTPAAGCTPVATEPATATSFVDTGLPPATAVGYRVTAVTSSTRTPSTGTAATTTAVRRASPPPADPASAAAAAASAPTGVVTGTVTATNGARLAGVRVVATMPNGEVETRAAATTAADGTYRLTGLLAQTAVGFGYDVCFDGSTATGTAAPNGFVDQCFRGRAWDGDLDHASGEGRGFLLLPGQTLAGVDATLAAGSAIAGTVRATDGTALPAAVVHVLDVAGHDTATRAGADGTYAVTGLAPGAHRVCVDGSSVTVGAASSGYQGGCAGGAVWDGNTVSAAATFVTLTGPGRRSGVDVTLAAGGALSGTVTAAGDGATVSGATVYALPVMGSSTALATNGPYVQRPGVLPTATTAANGAFVVRGLLPGRYQVCVVGRTATAAGWVNGFLAACAGSAWSGSLYDAVPRAATVTTVTVGATAAVGTVALARGSAVAGRVTGGGAGVAGVAVTPDLAGGDELSATTGADGSYVITALSAGSASVCFDATGTGFGSQCYRNVAWNPDDSRPTATTVSVPVAGRVDSVSAALTALTTVSGTVTASAGGAPVPGVVVQVFGPVDYRGSTTVTASDGTYRIALPAGRYQVCFDAGTVSSAAGTGFASQCYRGVAWDGGYQAATGSTSVAVTTRQGATGVDAALAAAGSIAGAVSSGGAGIAAAEVTVLDPDGTQVAATLTGTDGRYVVNGLAAGSYDVCVSTFRVLAGVSTTGYLDTCVGGGSWNGYQLPAEATPVPVTGTARSTADLSLQAASAVVGTVRATTGGAVHDVDVQASSDAYGYTSSAADGTYRIVGLPAGSYTVCFDAGYAGGGTSTTGYLDQCWRNVAWDGTYPLPSGATAVTTAAGTATTGIDASLAAAGAVSGRVAAPGGAPLSNVVVAPFDPSDQFGYQLQATTTAADGTYVLTGVSHPVVVCFTPIDPIGGSSATGYLPQCWRNAAWNGNPQALPSTARTVAPAAGRTTSGVDATLALAGGIGGTVTETGGAVLGGVGVSVWSAPYTRLTGTTTDPDGSYRVTGLPAGTYRICFAADPASTRGGTSTTGWVPECWSDAVWATADYYPPATASTVQVGAGASVTGIDAGLAVGAAVSGHATATGSGSPLAGVAVTAFDPNGRRLGWTTTDATGGYAFQGLPAGGTDVCFDGSSVTGTASPTGYLAQCWNAAGWTPGFPPPGNATTLALGSGTNATGVDAVMTPAAAVTGKVVAVGGVGLASVSVVVFDAAGHQVGATTTGFDGTYTARGLAAGSVRVCFDPRYASGGDGSAGGWLAQCWRKVAWPNTASAPAGATTVALSAGRTATGVSATLADAGAISGSVTSAVDGSGLLFAQTIALRSDGSWAGSAYSGSDGSWTIRGLPTGSYRVCVQTYSVSSDVGYQAQCWKNQPWRPVDARIPAGAKVVRVKAGTVTPGITAVLPENARFTGTVRGADGSPLGDVGVEVFGADGASYQSVSTGPDGTYVADYLQSGTYTVCFVTDHAQAGSPAAGYADQCWNGVAWTGGNTPAAGATTVTTTGGVTAGIDATLTPR